MFAPFDPAARVHIGVVALGTPERLRSCLEALVGHRSRHQFVVTCLVNPLTVDEAPITVTVPAGIEVLRSPVNLGWAGGLHRLRPLVRSEYFVWGQDDMVPEPGWLDALVDAADAHPSVGAFGSVGLGEDGAVVLHNGGMAVPPGDVAGWSSTDKTPASLPDEVTVLDWITSKGMLTRTAAFDEVSGPDPRMWPLNRVDLDYCTHLRCHGWETALVPAARVRHAGSQSAPSTFRTFLLGWRDPWFDQQWAAPVTALHGRPAGAVDHRCAPWRDLQADAVEVAAGREAATMVVPLARFQSGLLRDAQVALEASEARLRRSRLRNQRLKRRLLELEPTSSPPRRRGSTIRRLAGRLRR